MPLVVRAFPLRGSRTQLDAFAAAYAASARRRRHSSIGTTGSLSNRGISRTLRKVRGLSR